MIMKKMLLGIALMILSIFCFLYFFNNGGIRFDTISLIITLVGLMLVAFGYVDKD